VTALLLELAGAFDTGNYKTVECSLVDDGEL
jgi:hypothetical protein